MDLEGLACLPGQGERPPWTTSSAVVAATVLVYLLRAWRWGYLLAPLGPRALRRPLLRHHGRASGPAWLVPARRGDRAALPRLAPPSGVGLGGLRHDRPRADRRPPDRPLPARPLPLRAARARGADARSPALAFSSGAGSSWARAPWWSCSSCSPSTLHAEQALAFFDRLLRKLPSGSWLGKPIAGILRAFSEGLAVLQAPPATLLVILGQSFLVWLLIASGFHWTHLAFGLDLPFHATFLLVAFLTVGVAIPTPGMVGGFHAFYLIALHEAFGVPDETAVAAGLDRPRPQQPARSSCSASPSSAAKASPSAGWRR